MSSLTLLNRRLILTGGLATPAAAWAGERFCSGDRYPTIESCRAGCQDDPLAAARCECTMMFPARITRGVVVGAVLGGAVAFAAGGNVLQGLAIGGIVGGVAVGLQAYEGYMQARYGGSPDRYAQAISDSWRADAYAIHDGSLTAAMESVAALLREMIEKQDAGQEPPPAARRRLDDDLAFLTTVAGNAGDTDATHGLAGQRAQERVDRPVKPPPPIIRATAQAMAGKVTIMRRAALKRGLTVKMPFG